MSKAGYVYLNREGVRIDHETWLKHLGDDSYRTVRQFDNGVVKVTLFWVGKLNAVQRQSFRDTWPVFEMRVLNYKADGNLAADPVADGQSFPDEESAIKGYEEFLLQWTDCDRKDDGSFVEVDNHLAPPPPPDPDAPTSSSEGVKGLPEDLGAAW
jgi:hypothetical protein